MATVEVCSLSYTTPPRLVHWVEGKVELARSKLPKAVGCLLPKVKTELLASKLKCVSFTAKPWELTAILSADQGELRTISQLIAQRTYFGTFDGHVYVSGLDSSSMQVGYVSRVAKDLYIPGLSYYDMLYYAARLRLDSKDMMSAGSSSVIADRVKDVLDYMDLQWCQHRVIPERPSSRGEIGGELRRLIIATEIISLPKIIVLDDPARGLDPAVATHLFRRLKALADSGYTIIAAVPQATHQIYDSFSKTVLISSGYSIYSGPAKSVKEYFTSSQLSYKYLESRNPADFLIDISLGIERPRGQRDAPEPQMLQRIFEASPFFDQLEPDPAETPPRDLDEQKKGASAKIDIMPKTHILYYGLKFSSFVDVYHKSHVVIERAFYVKFRETEVLKKSFGAYIFLSLFIGYFAWQTGDFGDYSTSLFGFPYADTANTAAMLFMSSAIILVSQVLNVHIICQKIRVFRYEQKAGISPYIGFWLATVTSEVAFAVFFTLIFAVIFYLMTALGDYVAMPFYLGVCILNSIIGSLTTIMLAAVFRTEIVVRDLFLICTFMMLFTAGFIFTLPTIRSTIRDISTINPLRWMFEALMVWKFTDTEDGDTYLKSYGFESFNKNNIWEILTNFVIFSGVIFFLALLPGPKTLHRMNESSGNRNRLSTASADSTDDMQSKMSNTTPSSNGSVPFKTASNSTPRKNSKRSTPAAPLLFLRESSISGKKSTITSQHSHSAAGDLVDFKGPTVIFSNITYRVQDRASPMGYRDVLHDVSGQFDWGKLGVIMGAASSGKSTLLQVLGGIPLSRTSRMSGKVFLDNKQYSKSLQPWQLSAYVGQSDEHFRDLSVSDIVTYANKLRCLDMEALSSVNENVKNTLDLLQLTEFSDVKSKHLTPGARKRLSIAEEIVNGPMLLLIDEPLTGLDTKDIAIIMNVFRELVNQDRTVIATVHQPTADVFELFDTLLLLSKGRVIYTGPRRDACDYFTLSPGLQFDVSIYFNQADFLLDISSCSCKNVDHNIVDAPTLDSYFRTSGAYRDFSSVKEESSALAAAEPIDKYSAQSKSRLNPILERIVSKDQVSTPAQSKTISDGSSQLLSAKLLSHSSFDMSYDDPNIKWRQEGIVESIVSSFNGATKLDYRIVMLHSKVIFSRSFFSLFWRQKLLIGSLILHLLFAFNFWVIMGDSSEDTNPVVGFFAVSGLVLIVANVQFGYYLFKCNEVFLRENSRGLYSCFMYWMWAPLPYLFLRGVLGLIYGIMVVEFIDISKDEDDRGFFLLLSILFIFASATIGEALISVSRDIRTVYTLIPGFALMLFFFSGLMIKPSTLPVWTRSWLPSVSVVRWMSQALTINEFSHRSDLFPMIGNYDTYHALLELFGWGGKTKWDCLIVVCYNVGIFRFISYIALLVRSHSQVGMRGLAKVDTDEDRLY